MRVAKQSWGGCSVDEIANRIHLVYTRNSLFHVPSKCVSVWDKDVLTVHDKRLAITVQNKTKAHNRGLFQTAFDRRPFLAVHDRWPVLTRSSVERCSGGSALFIKHMPGWTSSQPCICQNRRNGQTYAPINKGRMLQPHVDFVFLLILSHK